MTLTHRSRSIAETMAKMVAHQDRIAVAVFDGSSEGLPVTCICPLTEFADPAKLIVIYDPRS